MAYTEADKRAQRKYAPQKSAKQRARRALIGGYKARPCMDCGGRFPPEAMDFDHVRGEKLFSVGQAGSRSLQDIFDEMEKCGLVCANCHRVRTRKRLSWQA